MTCKIEQILTPDGLVVLRVSGRIDAAHVEVLRELTEKEKITKGALTIDLTEVSLVSHEAVGALALAEANGIELRNCPAYTREWVSREKECGAAKVDHDAEGTDDVARS
jgi:STAS domain-containing protein